MKLEKFKEKDNKKVGIILFTITCVLLISGVILYRTFAIFETNDIFNVINGTVEDVGDIYFAFYKDGVIQKEIPKKEDGYVLDEKQSYCGVLGKKDETIKLTLNQDTWAIMVTGVKTSRTKCNIYFKSNYDVKVNDENYSVSTRANSLEISKEGNILLCNNGITANENNNKIVLNHITKDGICKFYSSSSDALENVDDSENYILFLVDETLQTNQEWTILANKKVTFDLNGHNLTGNFINFGDLSLVSSNSNKGEISFYSNDEKYEMILNKENSILSLSNIKLLTNVTVVNGTEKILNVNFSELISESILDHSTILTSGEVNDILISNSKIQGPHGIGGSGGVITVISSEIIGTIENAISVNDGYKANITIKDNSKITGSKCGVLHGGYGTLNLEGTINSIPIITGEKNSGIYGTKILLEWNYGEIFGKTTSDILSTSTVTRTGTTITTEDKDGMKHSYLE